jgi:hypothetical protein
VRLSEELARVFRVPPARKKRRAGDQAPREIIPTDDRLTGRHDPFDAARERLKSQIPRRDED